MGCLPTRADFCPATHDAALPCEDGAGMVEERGAGGLKGGRRRESEGSKRHFVFFDKRKSCVRL
jgi:hypothetical protein